MTRTHLTVSLVLGALALVAFPADADEHDRELRYDLVRNGDRIGEHRVRFRQSGERQTVDHRIHISVRVLGIEAYHYDLSARETWEGDRLLGLQSTVDKNGEALRVLARSSSDGLRIRLPNGQAVGAPADAIVADPHLEVLHAGRAQMIDTDDGELSSVSVSGPTRETVRAGGREISARRYDVTGEHTATLWYDDDGLLVRKRLRASDGSTVVTVLR
jgi:hypothetical protein